MLRSIIYTLVLTFTAILTASPTNADELQTYIVHLSSPADQNISQPYDREQWYKSILSKTSSVSNEKPNMIFMYHHVITGFAAKMSIKHANALQNMKEILSVTPESVYRLHTTRSPRFLGLRQNEGFWRSSSYGKGVIIGLLDTGVTPGHPSFNDKGVPPPPTKWKGACESKGCNNKLIGLRNFVPESSTPVDEKGHGTHTSSTAAGSRVDNANVFENANGTAMGIAPLSHVAMYKVCHIWDCFESSIAAGMDAAIGDGVDILSISLGRENRTFYENVVMIGAFAAIKKGIFVSCSAGNYGPGLSTLHNEAPWILTVGASTIDRRIETTVRLGDNKFFNGESLYQPKGFDHKLWPLVYPGEHGDKMASLCMNGSLDHVDVKGKVVICDEGSGPTMSQVVKDAGGAAIIIANGKFSGETLRADANFLPASNVGFKEGIEIKKYVNSTGSPLATILFRGTLLGVKSAPVVAAFSSRGPNVASPGILKPDVVGPGVDIFAAWYKSVDNISKVPFNVISGTSMSCPHLAGTAALLKSAHPEWSPAAIKSAIMTTAGQLGGNGRAIVDGKEGQRRADVFAMGSGHVNSSKANDPGLVFDIQPNDYIPYLCGLGYTPKQIQIIVKKTVKCSVKILEAQLNYPSFAVSLKKGETKMYSRTVTNVGKANSTYTVRDVSEPKNVRVSVGSRYKQLKFTEVNQQITYDITFSRDVNDDDDKVGYDQGHMTWVSGDYTVRTPFSFKFE
ncbi:subtilisin-like protease [Rutidosis leptorrhynchoides]|uniref:subtilisin-like protease n=1 Tax=Rutidosis leptorrhynchoides TaxID=125765 RepID=UPI003A98DB53